MGSILKILGANGFMSDIGVAAPASDIWHFMPNILRGPLFFILLIFCVKSTAQIPEFVSGAAWDEAKYDDIIHFQGGYSGSKGDALPQVSLRAFCPPPANQGKTGACAGYAMAYGALSILYNTSTGQKKAFSPNFLYNQIKKSPTDCKSGAFAEDAIELMKTKGICLIDDFALGEDCTQQPSDKAITNANNFRIKEALTVFERTASVDEKIAQIKACLADNVPVVVNMQLYKSFYELPQGTTTWRTMYDDTYLGRHFLVVIGYNEARQVFEVMNSWGKNWADNGFAFVNCETFARWSLGAYHFVLNDNMPKYIPKTTQMDVPVVPKTDKKQPQNQAPKMTSAGVNKASFSLQGAFNFETLTALDNGDFKNSVENVRFDEAAQMYVLTSGKKKIGTLFQLKSAQALRGKYVYVWSFDAKGNVKLHFPKIGDPSVSAASAVPFMPLSSLELTIPSKDAALQLSHKGDDYLITLYSNEPLDIQTYLAQIKAKSAANADFMGVFKQVFGKKLIPSDHIKYESTKMFAQITGYQAEGVALPIVLKVTAQ
jgi:hypothetical protein